MPTMTTSGLTDATSFFFEWAGWFLFGLNASYIFLAKEIKQFRTGLEPHHGLITHQPLDTPHIIDTGGNTKSNHHFPAQTAAKSHVWKNLQQRTL